MGSDGSAAGGGGTRLERVAAVGKGRRRTVAEDIRRAPQQENIFAPTPRMNPSACVKLGRSVFVETSQYFSKQIKFELVSIRFEQRMHSPGYLLP